MQDEIMMRIHPRLKEELELIKKKIKRDIEKKYRCGEVIIPNTAASNLVAKKLSGKRKTSFIVQKINKRTGKIIFI